MIRITGGTFRSQTLHVPKSGVRPTTSYVREMVFNICQNRIEGANFLDLFSGSGIMGIEALSRGAALAVFVDSHPKSMQWIKKNVEKLGLEKSSTFLIKDVFKAIDLLSNQEIQFDIVNIDPPYPLFEKKPHLISSLFEALEVLLKSDAMLFIEHPKEFLISQAQTEKIQIAKQKRAGNSQITQLSFTKK